MEFIATGLFVFYACGSVVAASMYDLPTAATNLLAAITQGFAIATFVYAISHTSGGHINPAVTIGLMVTKHIGILRGVTYILAQITGGILGAGLLKAVLPNAVEGNLGTTTLGNGIDQGQGFLFEFILTFTLLFTIFGTALSKEAGASGTHTLAPLPIGFAVLIGVAIAFNFTGGSLNPARTFGPAIWSSTWTHHWIYWVGPLSGALAAGLLQRFVFLQQLTPSESERGPMEPNLEPTPNPNPSPSPSSSPTPSPSPSPKPSQPNPRSPTLASPALSSIQGDHLDTRGHASG